MYKALFGSEVAETCLLYIANYGEGHINGIARTFDIRPKQVQVQLEKLEAGGILVSNFVGNMRTFRINPQLAIKAELTGLLERILAILPESETEKYFRERCRPRRRGKQL
jgi:DNA-binding transcriptional ArsR family regulator